jgi:adenine-specific DNA-methyltransferase
MQLHIDSPPHDTQVPTPKPRGRVIGSLGVGKGEHSNFLIQGDNLDVLKALMPTLEGSVRCVYIDPPYNTQEDFAHYSDVAEHNQWLGELEERLKLLFRTLSKDGSLWISIDDLNMHYVKVACDRLFGRDKFVATIVWNHRETRENRSTFSFNHEYILVYARDRVQFNRTRGAFPLSEDILARYKNPDNDPRGPWQSISANVQAGHAVASQFYDVVAPNGKRHSLPQGRCWAYNEKRMKEEIRLGNIWFGSNGNGAPRIKKFLKDVQRGMAPSTLWTSAVAGTTTDAKKHIKSLFPNGHPFDTPKPEQLLHRILQIATQPGDLVLDAYLGSGTTASVAHKTGRRYIGIECGEHAVSICAQRLKLVAKGERGGISAEVGWSGGGGFGFVRV